MNDCPRGVPQIKRADWVVVAGCPTVVGTVWRLAKDGSWADVHWANGRAKRMQTRVLRVRTSLRFGHWTITDENRARELQHIARPVPVVIDPFVPAIPGERALVPVCSICGQ